jgi:hypothetical protein
MEFSLAALVLSCLALRIRWIWSAPYRGCFASFQTHSHSHQTCRCDLWRKHLLRSLLRNLSTRGKPSRRAAVSRSGAETPGISLVTLSRRERIPRRRQYRFRVLTLWQGSRGFRSAKLSGCPLHVVRKAIAGISKRLPIGLLAVGEGATLVAMVHQYLTAL